jgi:hypothetical protein
MMCGSWLSVNGVHDTDALRCLAVLDGIGQRAQVSWTVVYDKLCSSIHVICADRPLVTQIKDRYPEGRDRVVQNVKKWVGLTPDGGEAIDLVLHTRSCKELQRAETPGAVSQAFHPKPIYTSAANWC